MNRVLLALAIIVAASGCTGGSNSPDAPDNGNVDAPEQHNNTVFYTDSGFQPATLTIEQGETVTWLDRSSRPMWVASDTHPSHRQYSGTSLVQHCGSGTEAFDQCSPGDSYSFTFGKTGTWNYHNHRFQADAGTIRVG